MNAASPVILDTGYRPRPLQAKLHPILRRFSVLVAHRRFGKTVFCINHTIAKALLCPLKRPFYAYIAPFRNQAKTIAWPYLKEYTENIPNVEYNEAELKVTLPGGATIQLFGADNPDALRGLYFDGAVLDEYAQQNSRIWTQILLPAMVDRQGWAIFIGTPCGHDQFYDIYNYATDQSRDNPAAPWFAAAFKASETGIIPAEELDLARQNSIMETGDDGQYLQEFEVSFDAAIKGAYFGKLLQAAETDGRMFPALPKDPTCPVHTSWDIGVGDSTAIWFFRVSRTGFLDIVDYYESNGVGMDHYVNVLRKKGYSYGKHFAPHDAAVKEWGTGKTRIEQARALGINFRIVARVSVEDGINAARAVIPKCRFDVTKCKQGIEHLKRYRQKYDEMRKVYGNSPNHGPESHAADSWRYMALGVREDYEHIPTLISEIRACEPTLNELLSSHDQSNRDADWRNRI